MTEISVTGAAGRNLKRGGEASGDGWFRVAVYAILILSAAVYLPSIDGLALWDDRALIGAHRSLNDCFERPFLQHYFRPLVSVTFFLEWRAWGRDAFPCHCANMLIHCATTGALICLLRALFSDRWLAAAGGLLFAVQPAQVSTVAWIGGRTDSLCTMWLTLFLWTVVVSVRASGAARWRWAALAAAMFGLALLTKEQALAALPAVPAAHLLLDARNRPLARRLREAAIYSLPSVASALFFVVLWLQHFPDPRTPLILPPAEQALVSGQAAAYYCLLFVAPTLRTLHLLTLTRFEGAGWWAAAAGYALLAVLTGLAARWRRSDPAAALLLLAALLTYVPVSCLIPMPSLYVAPYRVGMCGPFAAALLALAAQRAVPLGAGLLSAAVIAAGRLSGCRAQMSSASGAAPDAIRAGHCSPSALAAPDAIRAGHCSPSALAEPWRSPSLLVPGRQAARWPALAALMLFAAYNAWLTVVDNSAYTSQAALFARFHMEDPYNIPTTCQYSRELAAAGRPAEAASLIETMLDRLCGDAQWRGSGPPARLLERNAGLRRRLRLQYGSSDPIDRRLAGVFADLAFARWQNGDRAGADAALRSALTVDRSSPYGNLVAARMEMQEGRWRPAALHATVSLAGQSERWESHDALLRPLMALGRWRDAEAECRACIALEPWRPETYRLLSFTRVRLRDYRGAVSALRQALVAADGDHIEERRALADLPRLIASETPGAVRR